MEIIKAAREFGKLIQTDERFKAVMKTREINDADEDLQFIIGEFNLKRADLSHEAAKPDRDIDRLKELDTDVKQLYKKIMENENMLAFNAAKDAFDEMLAEINGIITMCANGADPDTCEPMPAGCGGSCSSCSGCN